MQNKILISIVVPVFNAVEFLDEMIESVLKQNNKQWELILVDDGSTDGSAEICDYYVKRCSQIKCVHLDNSGVSSARNNGISLAKGDYVLFVDSDDTIEFDMIDDLIHKLEKGIDLIVFGYSTFPEKDFVRPSREVKYQGNDCVMEGAAFLYKNGLLNSPCNKLYNLATIKSKEIKFVNDVSLGEDLLFNLDYLKYCGCLLVVTESYYNYRINKGSSLTGKIRDDMLDIQLRLKNAIQKSFESCEEIQLMADGVFLDIVIHNLKMAAYSFSFSYFVKQKWIKDTICNETFCQLLTSCANRVTVCGKPSLFAINNKLLGLTYLLFRSRKVIAKLKLKVFK